MSALQTMVFLTFVILLASGSFILLSSCDLFSFSSPAPSGFLSVPDSGLRSFFWLSLLYHPYPFGTWWWKTTKGDACCST
jgi:hypothetical protein